MSYPGKYTVVLQLLTHYPLGSIQVTDGFNALFNETMTHKRCITAIDMYQSHSGD